ncbi:MAG: hypothetical protein ACXVBE_06475 [Bdellovibrionota bacterium]
MDFKNLSPWLLVSGFIFGVYGFYFFKMGKNEQNGKRLLLGLALMGYGFFVTNIWLNWLVGIVLVFLNYRWSWIDE